MMVKQDYNELADAYGRNRKLHPLVLERLIEFGTLTAGSSVLEIGCGTGNYIRAIAVEMGAMCTGVDPSREMLRIAQGNSPTSEQSREGVRFIKGAAEELLLLDQAFDLAFSVDVIHHVQRRDEAAREAFRVLQPGGVAVIVTESEDDIRQRMPQVTYFPETIDVELARYPALDVIERELVDAGFQVAEPISVSMPHAIDDLRAYRDKAFSSLHLIPDAAFEAGIARMERDLRQGSIQGNRRYTMVIAERPDTESE